MSLMSQSLFRNPKLPFTDHYTTPFRTTILTLKPHSPNFHILTPPLTNPSHFTSLKLRPKSTPPQSFDSHNPGYSVNSVNSNFGAFLSILELVCLGSSAIVSIGFAANYAVFGPNKIVSVWLKNKVVVWQVGVLVVGAVIGALLRRRQWRMICREEEQNGRVGIANFVGRIEKLEEDVRTAVTMIRALSRQLEKLGIRFRVTRKTLKDPIAETAALAQKNSEATQVLSAQEDRLERELGEIQKVLLAMQEQQQKQLELILAIAKTGKLLENKRQPIIDGPHNFDEG